MRILFLLIFTAMVIGPATKLAAQATIAGKVYNYTTNQKTAAEWIVLAKTGQGLETVAQFENAADYRFENVAPSPNAYMVRVSYGDVIYSQTLQVTESREYQVDVVVYESSPEWANMTVRVPHMIVVRSGNRLNIEQTFEVTNSGRKTYHIKDNKKPTFTFRVPKDVLFGGAMFSYNGSLPLQSPAVDTEAGKGVSVDFKPGTTQIQLAYSVDYSATRANLVLTTDYNLTDFNVFVSPYDIAVQSSRFTAMNDAQMQQNNFAVYRATDVRRGEAMTIDFAGGSQRAEAEDHDHSHDDGDIVAAENAVQAKSIGWIAMFISILLLLTYLGMQRKTNLPVYKAEEKTKSQKVRRQELVRERDKLASKIAELDELYAKADMDEKAYHKRRDPLKSELRRVVEQMHH